MNKENEKPKKTRKMRNKAKITKISKTIFDTQNQNVWLAQSTFITLMQYNYTLLQSKIFLGIIDKLQCAIKEQFSYKGITTNPDGSIQTSLFQDKNFFNPDNRDSIRITFKISDFGVERNQYSQLKDALRAIAHIPVKIPRKINGRDYEEYDNLCSTIVPKDVRTEGDIVYIDMKKKTAEKMLTLTSGYTMFLKQTVLQSQTSYTPRFYMILSLYKGFKVKKIEMKYLRELLCLEDKYKIFRDFVKRVLDAACDDLKRMAEEGIANFWFEWDKWYAPNQKKAGEPTAIIFKFHSVELNTDEPESETLEKRKDTIYNLLRSQYILMDEDKAIEIKKLVTLENFILIQNKIAYTFDYLQQNKSILHKGDYMYKSIIKEISGITPPSVDIDEDEPEDVDYEEVKETAEK